MATSHRERNRREVSDLLDEPIVQEWRGQRGARQNRPPQPAPRCPSSAIGRHWFPGDRKFDPASGGPRIVCANCGEFEYVIVRRHKAEREGRS